MLGDRNEVSRIGLGTWAIGGWMWGGTDEQESIRTIHTAIDKGINLIDTAPVYGFGRSEEIVGKAISQLGSRNKVYLATKVGLEWRDDGVYRNSTPERLRRELEDSLRRLQTDYIDLYQVHWPDPLVPIADTAATMAEFLKQGKVRYAGVSNYDPRQMETFQDGCQLHTCQPPYNLFERAIERDVMPWCKQNNVNLLGYGSLCRGLLSGKMKPDTSFEGDDLRKLDPKFAEPRYGHYLAAVDELDSFARESFGKRVLHLAVRWALDKGVEVALWGARRPDQLDDLAEVTEWSLPRGAKEKIEAIVDEHVTNPVGPQFMAPPPRPGVGV